MRNIEKIFSSGGNYQTTQIAIDRGFLPGAQLPKKITHEPLFFADQNPKAPPTQQKYMAALAKWRPMWATVLDINFGWQVPIALAWGEEARQWVRGGVIYIPKVPEIMHRFPTKNTRIGYSVPTSHGGTSLPLSDFYNKPLHLLGGHPMEQRILADKLWVESFDQNYVQKVAIRGKRAFDGEKFVQCPRSMSYLDVLALSLEGVARLWK
jgi:hypothetical protein